MTTAYSRGRIQDAVHDLKAGLEIDGNNADTLLPLTNCYLISGRRSWIHQLSVPRAIQFVLSEPPRPRSIPATQGHCSWPMGEVRVIAWANEAGELTDLTGVKEW